MPDTCRVASPPRRKAERDMQSECWTCQHRREVPGDSHIRCAKPDPDMTGHEHGIRRGWFIYPLLFDPTWKTRLCANYEQQEPRS